MATKAQKRLAAKAKREAFEAENKESGLRAQGADKSERERQAANLRNSLGDYNQRLEQKLRSTLVEEATRYGRLIRKAEVERRRVDYDVLRQEWRDFTHELRNSPHKNAIHEAYWNAFKAECDS